jgi:hypothetical protein
VLEDPYEENGALPHVDLINQKQFETVSSLFDDYYDVHEPWGKYEAIAELKRRLNRENVFNVNVIENEEAKIKKTD